MTRLFMSLMLAAVLIGNAAVSALQASGHKAPAAAHHPVGTASQSDISDAAPDQRRFETEAIDKQGRRFPVEITMDRARDDAPSHYVAFVRDISRCKENEWSAPIGWSSFSLSA